MTMTLFCTIYLFTLQKPFIFFARILQFKQPLLHLCQQMHDYGYNLENLALQNIFLRMSRNFRIMLCRMLL